MSCFRCGRAPAKQVQLNIEGKLQTACLCEACLRELFSSRNQKPSSEAQTGACPYCGTTFANFQATGLLGCARCYGVFYERLLPYVQNTQGRAEHRGERASAQSQRAYDLLREREELRVRRKAAEVRGEREFVERANRRLVELNRQLNEVTE